MTYVFSFFSFITVHNIVLIVQTVLYIYTVQCCFLFVLFILRYYRPACQTLPRYFHYVYPSYAATTISLFLDCCFSCYMLVISLILILLSNALLFASAVWQTAGKKVLTRKYMNKIIIIIIRMNLVITAEVVKLYRNLQKFKRKTDFSCMLRAYWY